jgi:bifunctional DNA-binding transcriptional regulator/antitoxin component of YhaV-PrlF toxin-antitoxin module
VKRTACESKNYHKNLEAIFMERYKTRAIDEQGRLSIPCDLRKDFGVEAGGNISLTPISNIVVMHQAGGDANPSCAVVKVNELGMIYVPVEIRHKMGWKEKDPIALYYTENVMILKSA